MVVIAVIALHKTTNLVESLERRFYDVASTSSGRQPSDRIAVIAIDDQSIANIGRWPWSRDVHARMIDLLGGAKAKVIANTTFFFEPQRDAGLAYIEKLLALQKEIDAADAGTGRGFAQDFKKADLPRAADVGADLGLLFPRHQKDAEEAPRKSKLPLVYVQSRGNRDGRPLYSFKQLEDMGYAGSIDAILSVGVQFHFMRKALLELRKTGDFDAGVRSLMDLDL